MEKSDDMVVENRGVVSAYEDFPSSWTVLQHTSKNTDAADAINRLLNMYQPNDGILAYERVLKTLLVLSENFDISVRKQIISVVPLPKGATDDAIRAVIRKSTSLIGMNMSTCHTITIVPEDELNAKVPSGNMMNINQDRNILTNVTSQNLESDNKYHASMECKNSSELVPSVSDVFRGFPPNEISMIHSHVKNVNHVYNTLDYNLPRLEPSTEVGQSFSSNTDQQAESLRAPSNLKFKWFHTPRLLYKNNPYQVPVSCQRGFFKSLENKCFQLPVTKVNNYNQCNLVNVSQMLYQDNMCFKKESCSNEVVSNNQDKNEILNLDIKKNNKSFSKPGNCCQFSHSMDINQEIKNYNNNEHENRISDVEAVTYFEQEIKMKQGTVQEDIYKMDFVRCDEDNESLALDTQVPKADNFIMDNLTLQKTLKISIQNFLKGAEQQVSIELPVLSRTRSLHSISPTTRCWKLTTTQKNLEDDNRLDSSINCSNNSKTAEKNNDTTALQNKHLIQKKTSGSLNACPKLGQHDQAQLQVLQNNSEFTLGKAQAPGSGKKDDTENLLHRCTMKQTEQNNVNILQQAASITELTTFKKQYYDTLLSIQKAKVAVANSLAISSVESSTRCDPYYSSYSYQQQQLLRQQRQLTVSPQFTVHTMAQSGLSNMHGTPYTWVRYNDWKHPVVRQLRFQQQPPSLYSRNKDRSIPQCTRSVGVQHFMQDRNKQSKQCVQRKKLEDIVGKLKEVENGNVND